MNEKEKELEVTTVQSKPAADVNKEQGMSAAHAQTIPEAATLGNNSQFVLDSINPDDFQSNIGQNHKGKEKMSEIQSLVLPNLQMNKPLVNGSLKGLLWIKI